jgi:hypothetical protein
LSVLDAERQTARGPLISYIIMTQGEKKPIVGLITGNHVNESMPSGDSSTGSERTKHDSVAEKIKDKDSKPRNQTKKQEPKRT